MLKLKDNNAIKNFLGDGLCPYKILNFGGQECYVVGVVKIIKFSHQEVVVKVKGEKQVFVTGQDLFIAEYNADSMLLCGKIFATEVK